MLLCIDIGNTNITLGLYQGETLGPRWRLATDHDRMPDEFALQILGLLQMAGLSPTDVDGAAVASVVPPLTGKWLDVCRTNLRCEPLVVDAGVRTGVRVRYDDPKAVGADREVPDGVVAVVEYEDKGVRTLAAGEDVVAAVADDPVVAAAAVDHVVAQISIKGVGGRGSGDLVGE